MEGGSDGETEREMEKVGRVKEFKSKRETERDAEIPLSVKTQDPSVTPQTVNINLAKYSFASWPQKGSHSG